jgi:ribosomal protein S18 acetylase RimI-like enzyme
VIPDGEKLSDITIRNFRMEDYDPLISLWEKSGLPFKPEGRDKKEKIAHEIDHQNAIFLVAESSGEIVGSVFGTHEGRKGWINRLVVSPVCRRQGVAGKLVEEVERRLYELGIEIYACLVEDWNTVSMEVFRRLGYEYHQEVFYFSKRINPEV